MDRLRSLFEKNESESPILRFHTKEPYQYEVEILKGASSEFATPEAFLEKACNGSAVPRDDWRELPRGDWEKLISRRDGLADELAMASSHKKAWLLSHTTASHDNFRDFLAADSHALLLEFEEHYLVLNVTLLSLH